VEAAVAAIVPETRRVAGANRYETAQLLAEGYEKDLDRAFVVTGDSYPDALTGASLAGFEAAPLVLSRPGALPAATSAALDTLSPQGVVVLGGSNSVSDSVVAELTAGLSGWARSVHLQLLSFNDYHGHLEAESGQTLSETQDPDQNIVGGVEYLSSKLSELRVGSQDE